MKTIKAKIKENKKVAADAWMMRVRAPHLAKEAKPGQFVEVRCSDGDDPLLRRPLGVHRVFSDGIALLYEVVGKGTELLTRKRVNDEVDILGPLGNGFLIGSRGKGQGARESIVVAGGIGIAPLVSLAEKLGSRKNKKTIVLIGAKTKEHILCEKELRKMGCDVRVATDDGSKGHRGLVTDLLKKLFPDPGPWTPAPIYACGPMPMLKAVAAIACERNIPCQVSLEERMACGVGVCRGCPVKVRKDLVDSEYRMVCKDGPVFDAQQIVW